MGNIAYKNKDWQNNKDNKFLLIKYIGGKCSFCDNPDWNNLSFITEDGIIDHEINTYLKSGNVGMATILARDALLICPYCINHSTLVNKEYIHEKISERFFEETLLESNVIKFNTPTNLNEGTVYDKEFCAIKDENFIHNIEENDGEIKIY